jgi:drug/metabolite transporter (DMT)-like permease
LPRSAFAGALAAIILWGLSFVATKSALAEMSVVALVFTRFALGCVVLHAILLARGERLVPPRSSWGSLALLGFVGVFVHQMLQANGLTRTTAVKTGWLIGIIPIWSALLAALFLRERLTGRKILGLVVGFAGAVIVVTRGELSREVVALPSTGGDLLIVASTVNWAVYTVIARGTVRHLGSARATAGSMLLGWLMLAPLFLRVGGWREWAGVPAHVWGAVAFLGIGCSGLAYLFWYAALARAEASRVSAFLYLEPLVTCAAAVPLLGEPLGLSTVVGGLVVLGGVALLQGAGPPRPFVARKRESP